MTRVLHVNKFLYRRGGAEGYLLDLAALQRAAGHEVAFFGMDHPDNDVACAGRAAPYVEFEPAPSSSARRLALAGRMLWSTSARSGFLAALDEFRPDVVHAHNVYHQLSPSVLHAAARRGVPVVMTLHDYKLVCPTYQFLDRDQRPCTACVTQGPLQAVRRACKDGSRAASTAAAVEVTVHRRLGAYDGVRRFLAPSMFLCRQLAAAGVGTGRVRHQTNFTELPDLAELGHTSDGPAYFVVAGRLSAEKAVDTAIRAVGQVAGARLEVAGDGPELRALEALAHLVAPGRVRFHGRLDVPELRRVVAGARAVLVPSRWHENQPLAVLEAQALAVPVVTTDLGGLPELVDDDTGWIRPAGDVAALAAVLTEALDDPRGAARRGVAARRRVERHHGPQDHLRAIERHYQEASTS